MRPHERTRPYWLDEPYEPRPPLEADVEVDVLRDRRGRGGLSCALRLAQHGVDVAVLERGTVASGASGRNGGFLLAGVAPFHNDARERFGRRAGAACTPRRSTRRRSVRAGGGARRRRRAAGGMLRVAVPRRRRSTCAAREALAEDGFPGELVERGDLPPALRRRRAGGVPHEHDGALHPARWYRAARRAPPRRPGADLRGQPGRGPVAAPGEGPVVTDGGSVRARHVVVAADGALPALVPEYAGRVRPRRLHMVATEPLPPAFDTLVYARWGYEYLQQRPDGRILGRRLQRRGRRDSYTDSDAGSPEIWERMERYLREELVPTPRSRTAGPAWSATPRTRFRTWARCRAARASTCRAATRASATCPGSCAAATSRTRSRARAPEPLFPADRRRVDPQRVRSLLDREARALAERTRESERMYRRAERTLAGGVASSYQRLEPWPVYLERGEGARVWDVDGNEYLDFHNGFSAMVQGHAHPAITAAVRAASGSAPTSARRPRTRWRWPRSWPGASASRAGASPTRAPSR